MSQPVSPPLIGLISPARQRDQLHTFTVPPPYTKPLPPVLPQDACSMSPLSKSPRKCCSHLLLVCSQPKFQHRSCQNSEWGTCRIPRQLQQCLQQLWLLATVVATALQPTCTVPLFPGRGFESPKAEPASVRALLHQNRKSWVLWGRENSRRKKNLCTLSCLTFILRVQMSILQFTALAFSG